MDFDSKCHRIDGPAHIEISLTRIEKWYHNGILYRSHNKPPYVEYYENKLYFEQWMNKYDKLHRDNLPARIWYHPNGKIHIASWYNNNESYREHGGPDFSAYDKNGVVNTLLWKRHLNKELDGPLSINHEHFDLYRLFYRKNGYRRNKVLNKTDVFEIYHSNEYDKFCV